MTRSFPHRPPGDTRKLAVIVGASSGIGEALARRLVKDGWRVLLAARRAGKLEALAAEFGPLSRICVMDVARPADAKLVLEAAVLAAGGADLVILSAGVGYPNPDLAWTPDQETIGTNVTGFAAIAQWAMAHFQARGHGHLVGITSVAKFRGSGEAAAYGASKAFASLYLDGLRDLARRRHLPITVTEICPGFVDTAMMKADKPFWVASPERAAKDIVRAIDRRAKHVYVTRRWALIGLLLRLPLLR